MNAELLAAVESASPEMIVEAFGAAMEAAYRSHPRDGAAAAVASIAAAVASIAAAQEAVAKAKAEAEATALAAAEAAKAAEVASAPVVA